MQKFPFTSNLVDSISAYRIIYVLHYFSRSTSLRLIFTDITFAYLIASHRTATHQPTQKLEIFCRSFLLLVLRVLLVTSSHLNVFALLLRIKTGVKPPNIRFFDEVGKKNIQKIGKILQVSHKNYLYTVKQLRDLWNIQIYS